MHDTRVSLMQPYFFPYLGLFELMSAADVYCHYDNAAFSKNGWQNRNRIDDGRGGWCYFGFSVVKSPLGTPISGIRLANKLKDVNRLMGLLSVYRQAPYFRQVGELVGAAFETNTDRLADISMAALESTTDYLGLSPLFRRSTQVSADFSGTAQEKVLSVCRSLGATTYINLSGGRDLYDAATFDGMGVRLRFTAPELVHLADRSVGESLSVLHTMMFNSPEQIRRSLLRRILHE